jgi:hypothetical protein
MRKWLSILIFLVPVQSEAEGFLGNALQLVKGIEGNAALSKSVRESAAVAAAKIERAALVQATREDALAERIAKLEEKVRLQEEVIGSYQTLVEKLKLEIAELKQ